MPRRFRHVRHERAAPGMREMLLYELLKGHRALVGAITDGRFSGGTPLLSAL